MRGAKPFAFLAVLSMYPKAETPRLTLDKRAALGVGKRRASCPVCPNHTESIAGGADRSWKEECFGDLFPGRYSDFS